MESASVPVVPDLAHTPRLTPTRVLAGLAVGWVVCLALIPLHIDRAFGLPAHPLLLHIPVVFAPVLVLVTIALAVRPVWRARYGLAWGGFAVVTLLGTVLTAGAGEALYDDRFGGGGAVGGFVRAADGTIREHKESGERMRFVMFLFVAFVLIVLLVDHLRATGRWPAGPVVATGLVAVTVLLGLGAGFLTIRTGHLGAKATWGRDDGPPRGGFPGAGQGTGAQGAGGQAPGAPSTGGAAPSP